MSPRRVAPPLLGLLVLAAAARSQEAPLPPGEKTPLLQFDVEGPTAAVTALAMRKDGDGETLYAAGLDKVVRAWKIRGGAATRLASYRLPIGPGNAGAVNALAVSDDGTWLAVAGRGLMRRESTFQADGVVVSEESLPDDMLRDLGNIYLVDLTKAPGTGGKVLRGHTGTVRALAFAPGGAGNKPVLVSAALERGKGRLTGAAVVWDVEKGSPVARLNGLPGIPALPGLVVRRLGDGPKDLRVTIAWPEKDKPGSLRVWDPGAAGKEPVLWEEGKYNSTAAGIGADRLLTGYLVRVGDADQPSLCLRRVGGAAGEARSTSGVAAVAPEGNILYLPLGMAALPDARAAVLLRPGLRPGQKPEPYLLTLYDVSGAKPVEKARHRLRNSSPEAPPVVAAAPGGRTLAVAEYDGRHTIRLFAVEDLARGLNGPDIPGSAAPVGRAVFVARGDAPGIWLDDGSDAGRVFDLGAAKFLPDAAGWRADQPDTKTDNWEVRPDPKSETLFHLYRRGREEFPAIELGKDQVKTAHAVLPPGPVAGHPIVALAHWDRFSNETRITLFDATTGKAFLLLNGHVQRIHSLAFSGKLPLLASVAGDRAVCVWSLRDLGTTTGAVEGLVLTNDGNKVVVHLVEPGSAAEKGGLKKDDVIEALGTAGGALQPVPSALAFHLDLAARKPGTRIDVKVGDRTLTLPVARGAEERKPLFSLFLPRGGGWVGWSPLGFYDASGPEAERLLGWHTNTGREAAPAAFAKLELYRPNFYRPGLLKLLADGKAPGQAPPKPPAPRVRIRDVVPDANTPQLYVVRRPQAVLELELDADYVPDDRDTRSWQVVRQGERVVAGRPMKPAGNRRWEAELNDLDDKAGDYRVTVSYRSEQAGTTVSRDLTVRYLPPPPALTVLLNGHKFNVGQAAAERHLEVMDEKLTLQVEAKSAAGDNQDLAVQLLHRPPGGEMAFVKGEKGRATVTLRSNLTLADGTHTLRVFAGPEKVAAGNDEDGVSRLELEVVYKPRPEKADVRGLRIVPEGERRTLDNIKGMGNVRVEVQLVDKPEVTLNATAQGSDPLTRLDLFVGTERTELPLPAKPEKSVSVTRKVPLPMNEPRRLALRAATRRSDPAEQEVWVLYAPALPLPVEPTVPGRVTRPDLDLQGVLRGMTAGLKLDLQVQVTDEAGKETVRRATVAPGADKTEAAWQGKVRLAPGENRIKLLLASDWRSSQSETFRVRYVRPPEIVSADKVKVGKSPLVEIKATVRAPSDLRPTGVKIDGVSRDPSSFSFDEEKKEGDQTLWRLTVKNVPANGAKPGTWLEKVALTVSNRDGDCEKPKPVPIEPPDKVVSGEPARIQFLNVPPEGARTSEKQFRVSFRVTSESPLKSVRLCRKLTEADGTSCRQPVGGADLAKVKAGPPFTLEDSVEVTLSRGNNAFCLVVENEGHGEKPKELHVAYVVPAPRVVVEKIAPLHQMAKPVSYSRQDGRLVVAPTDVNLLMLSGFVQWDDPDDPALTGEGQELQVLVNGMRQLPVELAARGAGAAATRRPFRTPIALAKAGDNEVQLSLPGLPSQSEGDTLFHLACTNPLKDQRLHVLIVGVDVEDAQRLKESFFQAIFVPRPPPGLKGTFEKEPFKQPYLYHVVAKRDATREVIRYQLGVIASEIKKLQQTSEWVNDVIVLYYQGRLVYANDTCYLETKFNKTDDRAPVEKYALDCRELPTLPGVQLLMLNAPERGAKSAGDRSPVSDPLTGVISYANLKEPLDTPAPRFLSLMGQAGKDSKEGRLSEVLDNLKKRLDKDDSLRQYNLAVLGPVPLMLQPPPK
jgi:WD40 repeat protein